MVEKFKEIIRLNGILDPISEVIFGDSGLRGENFASITEYVTVKFENPEKRPLHLFVKKRSDNESHNQMIDGWQMFQKETEFFVKYLPKAREFCRSKGKEHLMDMYPKCYHADHTFLAFENLVLEKEYILLNKEDQQDFETAKLALTNLAKHHAISHALIKESGDSLEKAFEEFPLLRYNASTATEYTKNMLGPSFARQTETILQLLEKSSAAGKAEAIAKLTSLKGKAVEDIVKAMEVHSDEFLVVNHGDYWGNNMMFLKEESGKLIGHIPIDFQTVFYCSPGLDLAYYFQLSVQGNVRREKFLELLNLYLDVLNVTAEELSHPVNLSMKDLKAAFANHFQYGFWFGLVLNAGGAFAVMKDVDITEVKDMEEMDLKMNELILKWMENHPDESDKAAKNIVEYVRNYDRFHTGEMFS